MSEHICDQCGKPYQQQPSRLKGKRHFCSRTCLGRWRSANLTGENAAHWQGGVRMDGERVQWFLPWHHLANKKGYVYRYQIVMELKLGRPLNPGEIVHHKDENQGNDQPDNLEVKASQSEHARLHGLQRGPEQMAAMRAARRGVA